MTATLEPGKALDTVLIAELDTETAALAMTLRLADQAAIAWIAHNSRAGIPDYSTHAAGVPRRADPGVDRSRRRLRLPRLRRPTRVGREAPHHPEARRRPDRPGAVQKVDTTTSYVVTPAPFGPELPSACGGSGYLHRERSVHLTNLTSCDGKPVAALSVR
jgi:hypothetical protein